MGHYNTDDWGKLHMKLKNDINKRNNVLGRLQDILNNLDDINSRKAENLVDWFVEKSAYYNKIENN